MPTRYGPHIPLQAFQRVGRRLSKAERRQAAADRLALVALRAQARLHAVPAQSSSTELDLLAALDVWRMQGVRLRRAVLLQLDPRLVAKIEAHFGSFASAAKTVRNALAGSRPGGTDHLRGGTEA